MLRRPAWRCLGQGRAASSSAGFPDAAAGERGPRIVLDAANCRAVACFPWDSTLDRRYGAPPRRYVARSTTRICAVKCVLRAKSRTSSCQSSVACEQCLDERCGCVVRSASWQVLAQHFYGPAGIQRSLDVENPVRVRHRGETRCCWGYGDRVGCSLRRLNGVSVPSSRSHRAGDAVRGVSSSVDSGERALCVHAS